MRTNTYIIIRPTVERVLGDRLLSFIPLCRPHIGARTPRRTHHIIVQYSASGREDALGVALELCGRLYAQALIGVAWEGYDGDEGLAQVRLHPGGYREMCVNGRGRPWMEAVTFAGSLLRLCNDDWPDRGVDDALFCMRRVPPPPGIDPEVYAEGALHHARRAVASMEYPLHFTAYDIKL